MPHHLLGVAEVSALLGVSRQRVDQLAASHPDFPRPEAELAAGRIWSRAAVEGWTAEQGVRRPGRRREVLDRLTDRARRALAFAEEEARTLNHNYVGCEHLVLGLIREPEGVAGRALASFGLGLDRARAVLGGILGPGPATSAGDLPFTPRVRRAFREAEAAALELSHNYMGTEHVLLGVLREGTNVGCRLLTAAGIDLFALRLAVLDMTGGRPPGQVPRSESGPPQDALDRIVRLLAGLDSRLERLERRLSNRGSG